LTATSVDFLTFHLLVFAMHWHSVEATLGGNITGAAVSFWMQQRWVFKDAQPEKLRRRILRFLLGVGVCIIANTAVMALLTGLAGWAPWPSRVLSACAAWLLGFWFNRKVVFGNFLSR
jgi:putative flippase GtrA